MKEFLDTLVWNGTSFPEMGSMKKMISLISNVVGYCWSLSCSRYFEMLFFFLFLCAGRPFLHLFNGYPWNNFLPLSWRMDNRLFTLSYYKSVQLYARTLVYTCFMLVSYLYPKRLCPSNDQARYLMDVIWPYFLLNILFFFFFFVFYSLERYACLTKWHYIRQGTFIKHQILS